MSVFETMRGGGIALLASVPSAAGLCAACGGDGANMEPAAEQRLVEIIASDYDFNPERIFAEPGEELIIALRNEGEETHSVVFELPEVGSRSIQSVTPQQTERMTITAPAAPGDYPFLSPVESHAQSGMAGTLTVRRPPAVELEQVASNLTAPVTMAMPPDGSGRRFIVDQVGQIWILMPDGRRLDEPFLDVQERMVELDPEYDERGLLGLAFHPQYAENGRFFIYYSAPLRPGAPDDWDHTSHLSEFSVSEDANRADMESERVLLAIDQPQTNHNAGTLLFGPDDGYLYIALGDGGGAGDDDLGHTPGLGNGQDVTNLLGSILRIDVDSEGEGGAPYAIPPDNPLVDETGRAEIYAYGFRNPYRFSFDRGGDHAMFAGDAGQNAWEEVSIVAPGENYGWRRLEGTHCFEPGSPLDWPAVCEEVGPAGEPLRWPTIEIPNAALEGGLGLVVIGGHVYRGDDIPALAGRYVFGVWSRHHDEPDGRLYVANDVDGTGNDLWATERVAVGSKELGNLGHYLLGFGEDEDGALYVLTSDSHGPHGNTGKVFELVAP